MLILTLILPYAIVMPVNAEDENTIVITNGSEFVTAMVSSNFGKSFVIEGSEKLSDGSYGIIIPSSFTSVDGFFGSLTGVSGKNNIEMSKKSLFLNFGAGETKINNIVLKGAGDDFTMSPIGNENHFGVLVSNIKNAESVVEIKNVINYVDITSPSRRLSVGGIVGFTKAATVKVENCINFGNITVTHDYVTSGGIVGGSNGVADTGSLTINKCYNYGNLSSSKAYDYNGGIYGGTYEYNVTATKENNFVITNCGNYGNIYASVSTSSYSGGIAGFLYKADVSKSFNIGEITGGGRYSGGIVGLVRSTTKHDTLIYDCINAGKVRAANTATGSLTVAESPGGIASTYNSGNRDATLITGCYNIGIMGEKPPVNTSSNKMYYSMFSNSKSDAVDCLQSVDSSIDDYISLEDLAKELPDVLSSDIWEYVSVESIDDEYIYPQIKGNTIWYDYKNFNTNDFVVLKKSDEVGEISNFSSEWEKEIGVKELTNLYKNTQTGYGLSELASWDGVDGLTILKPDFSGMSSLCTFDINKTAQIFIATDRNPQTDTVNVVNNNGFTQLINSNDEPVTISTKAGAVYYISEKTVVVPDANPVSVSLGNSAGLGNPYVVFINWLDNANITLDLSGKEELYINDELVTAATFVTGKGASVKLKINPVTDYYVKALYIDGEIEKENIITEYEKSFVAEGDVSIKSETSLFTFVDEDETDDITYPQYQLLQETDDVTGLTVQSVKVSGNVGEILKDYLVTVSIKKEGSLIETKSAAVSADGSVEIVLPLGDTEGECTLEFTVNIEGNENKITVSDDKLSYVVPSVEDINEIIAGLNTKTISKNELKSIILEERPTLAFITDVFKLLETSVQDKILKELTDNTGYNASNLYGRFDESVIFNTLNYTAKSECVEKIFGCYPELTKINESELYSLYNSLDDKAAVAAYMLGIKYESIDSIAPQFEYAIVKNEIKKLISYDMIMNTLDEYDTVLGIETEVATAKAMNINELKAVNEGIGKSLSQLSTLSVFKEKLTTLIEEAKEIVADKVTPPARPPVSGGGGGGGGGGGVSVSKGYNDAEVELSPVDEGGQNAFTDLGDVAWARDSINLLFHKGIVNGKELGKFYPSDKVTRAEFVKMAVDCFGLAVENPVCDFTDLPNEHWAYSYVASASDIGIISGVSATEFGINNNITRQDMIAIIIRIIYRLGKYEAVPDRKNLGVTFTDIDTIADYALGGVTMLAAAGVVNGYEDGSFGPTKELTRAEAAVILAKVIEFFRI